MTENTKKLYTPCSITLLATTEFHSTDKICEVSDTENIFNPELVMEW